MKSLVGSTDSCQPTEIFEIELVWRVTNLNYWRSSMHVLVIGIEYDSALLHSQYQYVP